jgi:hypothetical protein
MLGFAGFIQAQSFWVKRQPSVFKSTLEAEDIITIDIDSGTGAVTYLNLDNTSGQNPSINWSTMPSNFAGLFFLENGVEKGRIDSNGRFKGFGFTSTTGVALESNFIERNTNQGKLLLDNMSASISGVKAMSDNTGTAIRSVFEAEANNAGSRALLAKGAASQTANLIEAQDSANAELFSVSSAGAIKSTALPSTPTNYTAADATLLNDHLSGIDTALGSAGGVGGSGTDNRVARFDGTSDIQNSNFTIDDTGNFVPTTNAQDLGSNSSSNRLDQVYAQTLIARPTNETTPYITFQIGNNFVGDIRANQTTSASATSVGLRISATDATGLTPEAGLGLVTQDDSDAVEDVGILIETGDHAGANATTSADIQVRTGDKTSVSSTGPSGDIILGPGTNAGTGGTGDVKLYDGFAFIDLEDTKSWWGSDVPGIFFDQTSTEIINAGSAHISFPDDADTTPPYYEITIGAWSLTGAVTSGSAGWVEIVPANLTNASSTINAGSLYLSGGDNAGSGNGGHIQLEGGQGASSAHDVQGYIDFRSPYKLSDETENITADNTNLLWIRPLVKINSNSSTASSRTITLEQCRVGGEKVSLLVTGGAVELIDDSAQGTAGNHRLMGDWIGNPDDTLELICDGTDWIEISRTEELFVLDITIAGANPAIGTSSDSTYSEVTNSGLSLTDNNSVNAGTIEIACASGTASEGTTCNTAAVNESVGVAFTISEVGLYKICAEFMNEFNISAGGRVSNYFQVVETSNTSDTITQEGNSRVGVEGSNADSLILGFNISTCGIFDFTSAGEKTIRLLREISLGAGSLSSNVILADQAAGEGQRDIHFYGVKL